VGYAVGSGRGRFREVDIRELEDSYIGEEDWEVRENANEVKGYSNFLSYLLDKVLKSEDLLSSVLPADIVREHLDGWIHVHKLPHSLYIPYCIGWSLPKLLKLGLRTPTLQLNPADDLSSFLHQLSNFIFLASHEWSGAIAFSGFDLYAGAFAEREGLSVDGLVKLLRHFMLELNYPARPGFQSPFTNFLVMLDTMPEVLEEDAVVGGRTVGRLGDYVGGAVKVLRALIRIYNMGDDLGQPLTFPIPTIIASEHFDWSGRRWGELTEELFENLSRRGTFYVLNGYATDVRTIYSMCCRLLIDVGRVEARLRIGRRARGVWAVPDATGSIGVITVNLPRIAFLSRGNDDKFYEMLRERLEAGRRALAIMRRRYERSLRAGLMPITSIYLGHLSNHFSTFGLLGLPEAAANFLMERDLWFGEVKRMEYAVEWIRKVVEFVRKYSEEIEEEDDVMYNIEEVPAESTAYRLASEDYGRFRREVERGDYFMPIVDGVPFYSNTVIPYYADIPLAERIRLEARVQQEFSGGVMMHIFLFESPDPSALRKLVYNIVVNTKIVYFSIAPAISVCTRCSWSEVGIYERCPRCGGQVDVWSRIVGYYRPVRFWNVGKKAEFSARVHYNLAGSTFRKYIVR